MMADQTQTPLLVNEKAGPDQWAAAIRYALMAASSVASALGYTKTAGEFSAMLTVAGPLAMVIVFAMGQWKTRQQSLKLATVTKAAPDSVAQIKA